MWIALSSGDALCRRYERGNFDLDLRALIDQAGNVEQRRGREVSPQRLTPGCTDTGTRGLIFAATGQIPGEANDVPGTCSGLGKQLDDPSQGRPDLPGHIGLIFTLLVASGLAGKDDPSAGTIDRDAVREAAWLRPFGRLQGTHEQVLPGKRSLNPDTPDQPILSTDRTDAPTSKLSQAHHCIGRFARCKSGRGRRYRRGPPTP